jgi:hypothetical protein
MSKATTNKAPRLMGLLIAAVTFLVSGCLPSTPGTQTPAATPPPTALSVETSKATPRPIGPTTVAVKVVECGLELAIPALNVVLRPTPKEYTITAVTEKRGTKRIRCVDGRKSEDTTVSALDACESSGVRLLMDPFAVPYTATLTVAWNGHEFSRIVVPDDFPLCFPNGPECKAQRCSGGFVLELPQGS